MKTIVLQKYYKEIRIFSIKLKIIVTVVECTLLLPK
jgi:hypothetical protein